MARNAYCNISFGVSAAGLSDVRVQPLTSAGANTGSALTATISEIGLGMFTFAGSVPDDAVHWKAYSAGQPSTYIDSGVFTLTPQQVADALKLAPSAGAPAEGSVYAGLEGAGGGNSVSIVGDVEYVGPVALSGTVSIYRGAAVTLEWSIADYTGDVADGDAISIRFLSIDSYEDESLAAFPALLSKSGTASLVDGTLTLSLSLSAAETATLAAGADGDGSTRYRVQVVAVASERPLIDVEGKVKRKIGVMV